MKKRLVAGGIGGLLLMGCWMILSAAYGEYLIPAPWSTVAEAVSILQSKHAWAEIVVTVLRVVAGFGSALIAGTLVGIGTVRPFFAAMIKPLLVLMQGMPPILWAIPLILVLGFGGVAPIVVIALICFPLVSVTIGEGMRTVPGSLRDMLRIYADGALPRLRELYLPHLAPFIASAVHLGMSLGIKASVVAEYFGANNGVGFQIQSAYQAFQVRRLFGWTLILVLFILAGDRLLSRVRSRDSVARSEEGGGRPGVARTASEVSGALDEDITELRERFLHPSTDHRIVLHDVGFGYASGHSVVSEINLEVRTGELAVVSGDSGTGKTTLLSLCSRLKTPDRGTVSVPGRLGFVFQDDRFLPWRSCLSNVALPLLYDPHTRRAHTRRDARSFAASMLKEVGLAGYLDRAPAELSGGMKKRLAFARCFASLPEAILLDEPFAGLDADARRALWGKFGDLLLKHPVPVVVVTHFPEEVPARLSPRFLTLSGHPATLKPID